MIDMSRKDKEIPEHLEEYRKLTILCQILEKKRGCLLKTAS